MSWFEPYIDLEGIHIPTYLDLMDKLIADYKNIFGEDVYLGEETPDYQLLSVFAKCWDDLQAIVVKTYNDRDPDLASGNSLDLLLPINGMSRRPATKSVATLTVTGDAGTVIIAGSKAIDKNGYVWSIIEDYTIPAGGSGSVDFECDTLGAISAAPGVINGIYTPVTGWSGVTNAAAAVLGDNIETDAEVRIRRNKSFSKEANGTVDAQISALINLDGVEFVSLVYNDGDTTDARGLPPHSLCAIVKGGTAAEIADNVLTVKAPGVQTYGNQTVNVTKNGQTYSVKFSRPTERMVTVAVTVKKLTGYDGSRDLPILKGAIASDINSLGVGTNWAVTKAYADVYEAFKDRTMPFVITSVSATNSHGSSSVEMQCNFDEILASDEDHFTITETT